MKECDYNHLLLYAKNWYVRGNILDDLRIILGQRCNIDPKYMTNRDMWEQLVDAFLQYCNPTNYNYRGLLLDMFKPQAGEGNPFLFWTDTATFERMAHLIVGHLGHVIVRDSTKELELIRMGEPDPKILPLSDSAKAKG